MRLLEGVYGRCGWLGLLVMVSPSLALAAPATICGERRAVFQCEVVGEGALALCGNYQGDALKGLQYRFARKGKTEVEFPKAGFSLSDFKANHYVRYQVDYSLIKFSRGGYTYGVYSNYDGEAGQANAHTAGVAVTNASDVEVANKRCAKIEVDKLQEVIPQLACDSDDALGCS